MCSDRGESSLCWKDWLHRSSAPLLVCPSPALHLLLHRSGVHSQGPAERRLINTLSTLKRLHNTIIQIQNYFQSVFVQTYLDEVIEDSFAGHVTVNSVVSIHEVRSEVMQQRVQVQWVVASFFAAVNTLTTLKTQTGISVGADCERWHNQSSKDNYLTLVDNLV